MPLFNKDTAPKDIGTLDIKCPICGPTKLKGILLEDKKWLVCNQCRLCIPDRPIFRKMLELGKDESLRGSN
jgi:hypothetical protein